MPYLEDLSHPERSAPNLVRCVQDDPQYNEAWLNLGVVLDKQTVTIDGRNIDQRLCFTQCLENDDMYWRAWLNSAILLPLDKEQTIRVRGETYDRTGCLVKALSLYDGEEASGAWLLLGSALTGVGATEVAGETVDEKLCYVRALERDPRSADAWYNLGLVIRGDTEKVGGKYYTKTECFKKALEGEADFAKAWYALSLQLNNDMMEKHEKVMVSLLNDQYDALDCCVNAVHYDPNLAEAWYNLSNLLRQSEEAQGAPETATVHGSEYDSRAALIKAINADPKLSLAWCNLATHLADDTITIDDATYGSADCCRQALQLDWENAFAWYNLGVLLQEKNVTTLLRGKTFDAKAAYVNAVIYDHRLGKAWYNLSTTMDDEETVSFHGKAYDKYTCRAKGESLERELPEESVNSRSLRTSDEQ